MRLNVRPSMYPLVTLRGPSVFKQDHRPTCRAWRPVPARAIPERVLTMKHLLVGGAVVAALLGGFGLTGLALAARTDTSSAYDPSAHGTSVVTGHQADKVESCFRNITVVAPFDGDGAGGIAPTPEAAAAVAPCLAGDYQVDVMELTKGALVTWLDSEGRGYSVVITEHDSGGYYVVYGIGEKS